MNQTPLANRSNIVLVGRRNAGKSSLINSITNQEIALVSNIPGTTTDPVIKAMELLPYGPVVFIDTAGIDDTGELGLKRVEKTRRMIKKADIVLWVMAAGDELDKLEEELFRELTTLGAPILGVLSKTDTSAPLEVFRQWFGDKGLAWLEVSNIGGHGINDLKIKISELLRHTEKRSILEDMVKPGDIVFLVIPIDSGAPKGRIILPQVQVLRELLDLGAIGVCVKETELEAALAKLKGQVALVITDSQVFNLVNGLTPADVPLTSFSILFAKYKGDLRELVRGADAVENLKPGDKVLIAEGCTHHRQEDDIGKVKIPLWLEKKAGGKLEFRWSSGVGYPEDIDKYKLIVHCGACMLSGREVLYRINKAREKEIPIVNYGVLIAYLQGILPRVLAPFKYENETYKWCE